VTIYPVNLASGAVQRSAYTQSLINVGKHESAHTIQAQVLGAFYLPAIVIGAAVYGDNIPLEKAADRYATGQSCIPF
jgi:hypothetical protein